MEVIEQDDYIILDLPDMVITVDDIEMGDEGDIYLFSEDSLLGNVKIGGVIQTHPLYDDLKEIIESGGI